MAQIIKIKQTELPKPGTVWSFGPDYMRSISIKSAAALCGMYPLPKMGYATTVAIKPDRFGGKFRLEVQNISGTFFLACNSVKVQDWPAMFNVEIVEPSQ